MPSGAEALSFGAMKLCRESLEALRSMNIEHPTPIQTQTIPALLMRKDLIGQARTGSGKTLAFVLPAVEAIDPRDRHVQVLVLTPTRELCIQVTQAIRSFGVKKNVEVVATFGGAPIREQMSRLRSGAHVVVGVDLTTAGCPLKDTITRDVTAAVMRLDGVVDARILQRFDQRVGEPLGQLVKRHQPVRKAGAAYPGMAPDIAQQDR